MFCTQLGKQLRVATRIVAILLLSSAYARSAVAAPESSTQTASVYWGAYIYGAPFNMALIDDVEAQAGKKMSIGFLQLFKLKDGKLTRSWGFWNSAAFATQLGLMPPAKGK